MSRRNGIIFIVLACVIGLGLGSLFMLQQRFTYDASEDTRPCSVRQFPPYTLSHSYQGWQTFTDPNGFYSFQYPPTAKVSIDKNTHEVFVYLNPQDESSNIIHINSHNVGFWPLANCTYNQTMRAGKVAFTVILHTNNDDLVYAEVTKIDDAKFNDKIGYIYSLLRNRNSHATLETFMQVLSTFIFSK